MVFVSALRPTGSSGPLGHCWRTPLCGPAAIHESGFRAPPWLPPSAGCVHIGVWVSLGGCPPGRCPRTFTSVAPRACVPGSERLFTNTAPGCPLGSASDEPHLPSHLLRLPEFCPHPGTAVTASPACRQPRPSSPSLPPTGCCPPCAMPGLLFSPSLGFLGTLSTPLEKPRVLLPTRASWGLWTGSTLSATSVFPLFFYRPHPKAEPGPRLVVTCKSGDSMSPSPPHKSSPRLTLWKGLPEGHRGWWVW